MNADLNHMHIRYSSVPSNWKATCVHSEGTLHQLSPYIGKLKSSIAGELITNYTKPGDLIVDPFSGAGTIPYEAAIRGRKVLGSDISPYSYILTKAKLTPPDSLQHALKMAEETLIEAEQLPDIDLRSVPIWVRQFFHKDTLKEAIKFAIACRGSGREYLMACFLGILHHQRPGFLSYPSSHLVPYLRDKKYPEELYPEMYSYRALKPRLLAKIERSYKRFIQPNPEMVVGVKLKPIQKFKFPPKIGAVITSPPYMNALDYGRDNRLRLWFIDPNFVDLVDNEVTQNQQAFIKAMTYLAKNIEEKLERGGYCVFVVGEALAHRSVHPSAIIIKIMQKWAPSLILEYIMTDQIPDVRRSRRECNCVKNEHTLIFKAKKRGKSHATAV